MGRPVPAAGLRTHPSGVVEILERGAVSFVAVPRPGRFHGPGDIESLFMVLAPAGHRPLRRIAVRRRRLPEGARDQRFFADVDRISPAASRLTEDVRGRTGGDARVLAVGHYALARHEGHVHLAYALARACARGERASAVGVTTGASFVLCVSRRSPSRARRAVPGEPLAPATPERLDVLGAEVALETDAHADGARPGSAAARDRVGDALVGALLRRGPRPRVAWFAEATGAASPARARRTGRRPRPAGRTRAPRR
jgi:hypothetical protein